MSWRAWRSIPTTMSWNKTERPHFLFVKKWKKSAFFSSSFQPGVSHMWRIFVLWLKFESNKRSFSKCRLHGGWFLDCFVGSEIEFVCIHPLLTKRNFFPRADLLSLSRKDLPVGWSHFSVPKGSSRAQIPFLCPERIFPADSSLFSVLKERVW